MNAKPIRVALGFKNAPESSIINVLSMKSAIEKATLTAAQSDLAKDKLNRRQ